MIDWIQVCAILIGLSVWLVARLVTRAPIGYEDKTGFHFGPEPCETEDQKG